MNSTFELDHFLDLNSDAFAPSTPPATTSEAASQAPFAASSSVLSPRPKSATTLPPTATTTTTTTTTAGVAPSATTTSMTPEFPAPSHPYHLHPQQTMPLMGMNLYGELNVMGLDNDPSALQPQPQFDFFSALQQSPALSDVSMGLNAISPLMTTMDVKTDATDLPPRERLALPMMHGEERKMYQGIHSDMMMAQQEKMLRQREEERASSGLLNNDDAKINHIFNSLRARPIHRQPQNNLPLLDKQKKEQAEMDEDEKLLASEEGKKLSSKERRQLRNKVSARAFRSRRKEYISQLESEVNRQAAERQSLRDENEELRISLQRYEAFIRNFLKTPYFNHLLDDLTTTDTEIGKILKAIPEATSSPHQQQSHQSSSSSSSHPLQPHHQHMQHSHHHQQLSKFTNPAGMQSLPSQTQSQDEWPLSYAPSSANPNTWPTPSPQVYTLSLPLAPAISELDLKSDPMAEIDDLMVADGFFPRIRNEKGVVDFSMLCDDEDFDAGYELESCDVPETVEELIRREKTRAKEEMATMEMREQEMEGIEMNNRGVEIETNGSRDLDRLFPGVGVNDLLERLERVAGGERVENVFNTGGEGDGEVDMDLDNVERKTEGEMEEGQRVILDERMLGRCNRVIERAEGVYRRIGLMVM